MAEPTVSEPTVASNSITTAHLTGEITTDVTGETYWGFQYRPVIAGQGPEEGWQSSPAAFTSPLPPETTTEVADTLQNLAAETEYEVRLFAYPYSDFAYHFAPLPGEPGPTFSTDPAPTAPKVEVEPASSVEYTTAHLQGTVNPEGGNEDAEAGPIPITAQLEARPEGGEWSPVGEAKVLEGPAALGTGDVPVEANAEGLRPATKYSFRLEAAYAGMQALSGEGEFETEVVTKPQVATPVISQVTADSAHLAAEVDPTGTNPAFDASWYFECSPACQGLTGGTVAGSAAGVENDATGLQPNTQYTVKVLASNQGGSSEATQTFTTVAIPPSATTRPAGEVGATEATLTGLVNPHNSQTEYWFEWGSEDCSVSSCQSLPLGGGADAGSGGKVLPVNQLLSGLAPETTYHFRLVAANSVGTVEGADRTFTTEAAPQGCGNESLRIEQRSTYLPHCRAYEMVSPPEKNGAEVRVDSAITFAAAGESPGLPAAVAFASGGFGDAEGSGIITQYLSQRTGEGATGWSTHGITPAQEPLTFGAAAKGLEPGYFNFSEDLTHAGYNAFGPLTEDPNVKEVPNLYAREDVRVPGPGSYRLLSGASAPLAPPTFFAAEKPVIDAATQDYQHVLFEDDRDLTPDAAGGYAKLYETDGETVHLIAAGPGCPGAPAGEVLPGQCSAAPNGKTSYNPRVLSDDGTRAEMIAPTGNRGEGLDVSGAEARLFQYDNQGTATAADDALIQLDTSEREAPQSTQRVSYRTASSDGSRVFFFTEEELTEADSGGLYMWERQQEDEQQTVSVNATGGTYRLTFHGQLSNGEGELTSGSTTVQFPPRSFGSFAPGQTLTGTGIAAGTTVVEVKRNETMTISEPATASGLQSLHASVDATTAPLPRAATAGELQSALEGLQGIGVGNVTVSGGPSSYLITFNGALAGVDVAPLSGDSSGLSGGAGSVSVAISNPVHNLTLISPGPAEVIGASEDGRRLYFFSTDDLVPGVPPVNPGAGIYLWQADEGPAGGTISYIGAAPAVTYTPNTNGDVQQVGTGIDARVTPDGGAMIFIAAVGDRLAPEFDSSACPYAGRIPERGCTEVYLYHAAGSTPTEPNLVCASCDPSGAPASELGNSFVWDRAEVGVGQPGKHLDRALSDDGRRVFFVTAEPLVAEDTNGALDVYEYDARSAAVHLISSGTDPSGSYLLDASADGHDVYFATRQQLLGWDRDGAYDVYDARVGGGVPEPPPQIAPCNGEVCRRPAAPPPPAAAGGSDREGPGNPKPRPRCPHGKHAVQKRGKTRCVSRHRRKHHSRGGRRAGK